MTNKINIIKSKYLAGGMILSFLTASTLFTFSSCADDHFNISSEVTGTKTIWENIKENKNLSDYAYILEHVPYSQKDKGFTSQTYADVLNGDQTFTIWAPTNGSYDFESYKKLIESGVEDNIKRVELELIRNNMTRYTHVMNGQEQEKLVLFNGKRCILDYANNTFGGNSVIQPNIASSNGVLHVTQAPADFIPNLYEYYFLAPNSSEIQKFLKKYETEEFDNYSSIPGPTVNGEITWVDSITYKYNNYLGQYLAREDSNYAVIIPTDNAWKQVYDKIGTYFNFRNKYIQDVHLKTETGSDTIITGKETVLGTEELDSIKKLYISNSILKGTFFNANWQPRQISIASLKDISNADSLETALEINSLTKTSQEIEKNIKNNHKFKKPGTLNETNDKQYTHEYADFTKMFGGNDPIRCSNGYAYITDAWNFPSSLYAPTLEYKAAQIFETAKKGSATSDRLTVTYVGANGQDSIVSYDYVAVTGSGSQFEAIFKLRDMLSCRYEIYLVTLHNNETNRPTIFKTSISFHNETDKPKEKSILVSDWMSDYQNRTGSYGEEITDAKKKVNYYTHQANIDTVSISPVKISGGSLTDTICIAKDYEIPYSYYGLTNAYPLITFTSAAMSGDIKQLYCREMRIVSIILKPKRDE